MSIDIGDPLPDLTLPAAGGRSIHLPELCGGKVLIYFYPKDNTAGCTRQAQDFRDLYEEFRKAGCEILGISRDSIRSHENFAAKHSIPYPLLSDADEQACRAFGVLVPKKLYGREYIGIDRSSWLFGTDGRLARVWRKVRVPGHAEEVLEAVRAL